jgi:hypothetical protein
MLGTDGHANSKEIMVTETEVVSTTIHAVRSSVSRVGTSMSPENRHIEKLHNSLVHSARHHFRALCDLHFAEAS